MTSPYTGYPPQPPTTPPPYEPRHDDWAPAPPEQVQGPSRSSWIRQHGALLVACLALVLSIVALVSKPSAGPPGPAGPAGVAGATGPEGPPGPAGADGADGATGAPAPAASAPAAGSGRQATADEKEQACRDTYKGALTQAQINTYCVPGGLLYD